MGRPYRARRCICAYFGGPEGGTFAREGVHKKRINTDSYFVSSEIKTDGVHIVGVGTDFP